MGDQSHVVLGNHWLPQACLDQPKISFIVDWPSLQCTWEASASTSQLSYTSTILASITLYVEWHNLHSTWESKLCRKLILRVRTKDLWTIKRKNHFNLPVFIPLYFLHLPLSDGWRKPFAYLFKLLKNLCYSATKIKLKHIHNKILTKLLSSFCCMYPYSKMLHISYA